MGRSLALHNDERIERGKNMNYTHIEFQNATPQPHLPEHAAGDGGGVRKVYSPPAIVYETRLQTNAGSATSLLIDGELDPELPGKPVSDPSAGGGSPGTDPALPAKPSRPSSGRGSPGADPALPPKPPSP